MRTPDRLPRTLPGNSHRSRARYAAPGSNSRFLAIALVLGAFAVASACAEVPTDPVAPIEEGGLTETGIDDLALDRRAPSVQVLKALFANATREELAGGVAHYRFTVPLGPGEFDRARIHRVVRERKPHHPVRTGGAVFMTHGAYHDFEAVFLRAGTERPGPESSVAVYLASNDIDVWGMDSGWTLVPEQTADFSFMRDWGVERDAERVLAAMSISRLIRGLTAQGTERLNLLGFSYGAVVAYAAAPDAKRGGPPGGATSAVS